MQQHTTLPALVEHWATVCPDKVWLRDLREEGSDDYTWGQAHAESQAVAAMLESRFGSGARMAILSRNRPHWFMADLAIIASGNVSVALFTTLPASTADYILDFTETQVLFLGETHNWEAVRGVLRENVQIITLPGVEIDAPHLRWEDIVDEWRGRAPQHVCTEDEMMALVFTSGTTGLPKGVIQTHSSNLIPIRRFIKTFGIRDNPRYFSYLPLSHIAERQIVEYSSIVVCGEVSFNESLETILRDLQRTRPHMFFGPPRIWEQFQQAVIARFGGQAEIDKALAADRQGIGELVLDTMGLNEVDFCLVAAAPTPPALIRWWDDFGLTLMEGFGQTEAMGLILSSPDQRRIGSIGKPIGEVEYRITEEGELAVKAEGCTPGYYHMPEKTAELIRDGWLHTGDKVREDEDGFLYITGRVKDYFKTRQGKYVAPPPIEGEFARNPHAEQQCLLGRGLPKTVMVTVLTPQARERDPRELEASFLETLQAINESVEKHARVGAVIVSREPWDIANEILTPTLKIRRDRIEEIFGALAEDLATRAAEEGRLLVHWHEQA
jgi:long-chain acyl-CoA synthetase